MRDRQNGKENETYEIEGSDVEANIVLVNILEDLSTV